MTIHPLPPMLDVHPDELEAIARKQETFLVIDAGQELTLSRKEVQQMIAALRYCKQVLESA